MSFQIKNAERVENPRLALAGQSGGALRRFRQRLAREGWQVQEDWKPEKGYVYTTVRAISARINQNYDGWPGSELKKAHHTFIGKPIFVNHQNEDPSKARGVVVASRYKENGDDKYVEVVMAVDAERFPKLAHEIITGGMDSVSMGCEAGHTICSACDKKAATDEELCDHVRYHKGTKIRVAGKAEPVLVWEKCADLRFFELSYVFEPADETAVVSKVLHAAKQVVSAQQYQAPEGQKIRLTDEMLDRMVAQQEYDQKYNWRSPDDPPEPPAEDVVPWGPNDYDEWAEGAQEMWGKRPSPEEFHNFLKTQSRRHATVQAARPNGVEALAPDMSNFGEEYIDSMYGEDLPDWGEPLEIPMYHHASRRPIIAGFVPHEGGSLDPAQEVFVHVNRHAVNRMKKSGQPQPDLWSIKQNGRVQGYMDNVPLHKARMVVQPAGSQRYKDTYTDERGEGDRTVHAGVYGMLGDERPDLGDSMSELGYNPKFNSSFVHKADNEPVSTADYVHFTPQGKMLGHQADNWGRPRGTVMARRKRAFGETEVPEAIDTLRPEDDTTDEDFHHYVESPPELSDPDLDKVKELRDIQESEGEAAPGSPEAVVEEFVDWCDQNKAPVDYDSADQWAQEVGAAPEELDVIDQFLEEVNPESDDVQPEPSGMNEGSDISKGITMARRGLQERARVASAGRRQHFADNSGHTDGGPYYVDDQGEQEQVYFTQVPPAEAVSAPARGDAPISNTENNLVAALRDSTARTQMLAAQLQAHRQRTAYDENAPFWEENNKAVEDRLETPNKGTGKKPGGDGHGAGPGGYPKKSHRTAADNDYGHIPETPSIVNPPLSGTDVDKSDLTGDFENPDPNKNPPTTQPKDAAIHAFQTFDRWLAASQNKQRTAALYSNERFIVGQVKRWARATNQDPRIMFPVLASVLRDAKNDVNLRQAAPQTSLDVAAPQDRLDVEAPTKNVTDAEAQASQYDLKDFADNASDAKADPDLSTDLAADLEGWSSSDTTVKSSAAIKTADAAQAVRLAEAYIKAGLLQEGDKWNAVSQFQKMRAGQVIDRTHLLEAAVNNVIQPLQSKVASGNRRGTVPQGIPAGFANGAQRTAATHRLAQNDPQYDSDVFL